MKILQHQSLKSLNTFGFNVEAAHLAEITSIDDVREAASFANAKGLNHLVLGGGSNVLFTKNIDGMVMLNRIKGIELESEDEKDYIVRVGAGENWHALVEHAIGNNWAGIENLALIPGNVGASPMQNIGAYGVEVVQVFEYLEAVHLHTREVHRFSKTDCKFGYRESVFKQKLKGEYMISHVAFRLRKTPSFNTSYGAIEAELEAMNVSELTLRNVADAVIAIRSSKLPDPKVLGNSGSFFKNPVVPIEVHEKVKTEWPDAPAYPAGEGKVKMAAGWLIEKAGWKGFRENDCGVHNKQALVLVNHGNATGQEVYDLSQRILDDVYSKFGVQLEREVNVL